MTFLILFYILFVARFVRSDDDISLVAFFPPQHPEQELAFRLAVDRINKDSVDLASVALVPAVQHVKQFDSFNMTTTVCNLMMEGIGGVIGPQSFETAGILQSISNKFHLPLIQTHWDIAASDELQSEAMVNIFPDPALLAKGLVAVVEDMDWESYTVIYEHDEALIRLQEILKGHSRGLTAEGHVPFTAWQLEGDDYRPLFKEVQQSTETHIILDCSADKIIDILEQAKEVNMMGDYHSYILTALDAHTVDFGKFKFGQTNITTLRLVDSQRHMVQAVVHDWTFQDRNRRRLLVTPDTVQTESALMNDAVNLFASAMDKLRQEQMEDSEFEIGSVDCSEDSVFEYGKSLGTIMKNMEMEGMTGKMKFDERGRRTFFTLDITELTKNGFRKIGSWDPESGMSYTRSKSEMESELFQTLSNKTFIVVSRLGQPYLRIANDSAEGNDRFEGYSKDIIEEIAKDLNFKFKFVLAPDGQYGSYNKETKQWNGLIRELRERRADLAICDLTITYERRSAVDFTMPFMTLGISILYSKPTKQPPDLFSFLSPLSLDVWIYMATAYLGVSLLLYFLARCTPDEWENPHPCNNDPTELECAFSLHNCLWFSIGSLMAQGCDILPKISPLEWKNPHPCHPEPDELENDLTMQNVIWHNCGSLMQQGSDIAPQAISTRVVAGMWWFFVLIMISSYTANLAAFLTMERMDATIESVEDLAKQNKIKYGVVAGGASMNFFKDSNVTLYQRMWSAMESSRPSVFAKSNDEGVERVVKGKRGYAFFMESTSIEYQMEKNCDLMQVGGLLDSKGYGIAMPFNSPYRIAISGSVLKMQESGKLLELKTRWWQDGKAECAEEEDGGAASAELGIDNVGGVFLVLIVGCGVAFLVSILEFLWNVRKVAVIEKISPKEAFMLELRFALQCYDSTKPVRHTAEDEEEEDEDDIEKSGSLTEKNDSFMHLNAYGELHRDLN